MHGSVLQSQGYEVDVVGSIAEGRAHWEAGKYDLVLIMVNGNLSKAIEFCEDLKKAHPQQRIALLAGWHTYVPDESCPDEVIDRGEPGIFVAQVANLIGSSPN